MMKAMLFSEHGSVVLVNQASLLRRDLFRG